LGLQSRLILVWGWPAYLRKGKLATPRQC